MRHNGEEKQRERENDERQRQERERERDERQGQERYLTDLSPLKDEGGE